MGVGQIVGAAIGIGSEILKAGKGKKARKHAEKMLDKQLDFAKGIYDQQRRDAKPWMDAGVTALDRLMLLSGLPPRGGGRAGFREGEWDWMDGGGRTITLPGSLGGGTYTIPSPGRRVPRGGPTTQPSIREMIMQDPSYQWRLQQGMEGLEGSAAARGGLLSGGLARKLTRYGQDYASTEYNNAWNRIASIAQIGQTGTSLANASNPSMIANAGSAYGQQAFYGASQYGASADSIGKIGDILGDLPWDDWLSNRGGGGGLGSGAASAAASLLRG